MRIIAGRFRGLSLANVGKGDAGAHLRPTTDRVRESLFSMLTGGRFGDPIQDAWVLDLFAGTGALGLEALSRGADHVTFVDDGRKSLSLIRENIAKCRCSDETTIIKRDATRLGGGQPHNLVFLDPPYGKGLGEKALTAAMQGGWVAPDALIVWEDNVAVTPPDGVELLDVRRYGDTTISICAFSAA
ncbi:16S rRNA (guanine966-N2)-methyltransferase [Aliiroseovarius sediminilitoris]|uniref:16S rRNA (Guanine966-N2)-methyltransferase n=1 Tax=Aliiroseovarius sediminilitoris TaxID=1173584 RepID=A0A1I0QVR8_9RHOB|nr:16S rRNA (guanine(966)-N(2))-methyltransferase RsmD [Aliiroseovarius sediminilitoris]SEW31543.1 16S rRNA (guanine966-N2)-methyltransferase [Aliiroseovarius sediminilitoris]